MNPQQIFPLLFAFVFLLVVGSFIFKIAKNGGFKAAMFGARIQRNVGEVQATGASSIVKTVIRVYALEQENSPEREIGMEVTTTSIGSYRMVPVTLSRSEARQLIDILEQAFHSA